MVPETAVMKFAGVTRLFVVRDNIAYQREVGRPVRAASRRVWSEIVGGR